jgi:hypothetical protein
MGISDYQLTRMMPKELKTNLPTIEEIETELSVQEKPNLEKFEIGKKSSLAKGPKKKNKKK